MERRLAAILAADVVGYSRLMAEDEAGTLAALKAQRQAVVEPGLAAHGGRIVKLMGDGLLAEFASVVDAVRCAVAIQAAVVEQSGEGPAGRPIRLRIGINLGDVMIEGDDIYGDGVNIAARLEGLAAPGGICVSGTVFEHVKGKFAQSFTDLGEQQVKNIPEPLRIYGVDLDNTDGAGLDQPPPSPSAIGIDLSLPDVPSIAVLPFTNMSGDSEQEFFSDGIAEDIITALSKVPSLLVVARNSSFSYKGKALDVKQVSREQGVRYVLEGSVRKAGKRVRVTAQLIDATSGHHLWAERYDRELEDIFAVQDDITRHVVIALEVRLSGGEQVRLWSSGTTNLAAWENVRLAVELVNRVSPEARVEAARLLDRALALDPTYAMAWLAKAWMHFHEADVGTGHGTAEARRAALEATVDCAQKAYQLDPTSADAYATLGLCHLAKGAHEKAIEMAERAVVLAPSHSENLALAAIVMGKSGKPAKALELIRKAMRLSPFYPNWYLYVLGTAYRLTGQNQFAVLAFAEGVKRSPDMLSVHAGLAATLGELGRAEEAKRPVAEILRLSPDFSIETYLAEVTYRDPEESRRFEQGLRKAGLPG